MLEPAHSIGQAGDFIVMKTDNGEHTRRQWARTTVGQIVQIDEAASPDRRKMILDMKQKMVEAIEPFFGKPEDMVGCFNALLQVASGTEWEQTFQYPPIKTAIFECIGRNLRSAEGTVA